MGIASQPADEIELQEQFEGFWNDVQDPIRGRSVIVNSFCPQIHGLFLVKLATLMTVIGGCEMTVDSAEGLHQQDQEVSGARKSRREGHLLLVGDPGEN